MSPTSFYAEVLNTHDFQVWEYLKDWDLIKWLSWNKPICMDPNPRWLLSKKQEEVQIHTGTPGIQGHRDSGTQGYREKTHEARDWHWPSDKVRRIALEEAGCYLMFLGFCLPGLGENKFLLFNSHLCQALFLFVFYNAKIYWILKSTEVASTLLTWICSELWPQMILPCVWTTCRVEMRT